LQNILKKRPDLECPENRELLAHWEELRGDAPVPQRSQFNPMNLPRHLPNLIVLEPDIPAKAQIRIFGTELTRRLGLDLTGADLFSLYQGQRAKDIVEMIACVVEHNAIAVAYSEWSTPSGHVFSTENVWVPLASDTGVINRVLGSIWEPTTPDVDIDDLGGTVAAAQRLSQRSFHKF